MLGFEYAFRFSARFGSGFGSSFGSGFASVSDLRLLFGLSSSSDLG